MKIALLNKVSLAAIVVFTLICLGCANHQKNIVGVWELQGTEVSELGQTPEGKFTNKKAVYTQTGNYYSIAADSSELTNTISARYRIEGSKVIYTRDGQKVQEGYISFPSPNTLIVENYGVKVNFKKISNNPEEIPLLEEKVVEIRHQGKAVNQAGTRK